MGEGSNKIESKNGGHLRLGRGGLRRGPGGGGGPGWCSHYAGLRGGGGGKEQKQGPPLTRSRIYGEKRSNFALGDRAANGITWEKKRGRIAWDEKTSEWDRREYPGKPRN